MIASLLLFLIRQYQRFLSPLLGNVCRFEPSCSRYAAACIAGHGAARGSLLSALRLCKCHPFHAGGYDPPPPPRSGTRGSSGSPTTDLPGPQRPSGPQGLSGQQSLSGKQSLAGDAEPSRDASRPVA